MAYTVTVSGLRKSYGDQVVLDGVDLAVAAGSVFALLGPNGAGKTTMVNILSTLVLPDSGTAAIAGHDVVASPARVRRAISLTGQYAAVDDLLTPRENLTMMAQLLRLNRRAVRARTEELLDEFDLRGFADRRIKQLSGGQRRRVDIAISLIHRPDLLFLDEPTTGLDPRSREQVWHTVRDLVGQGTTIFLTTQYLEEADRLADLIAMLHEGRIVAQGSADELKASLSGEVLRLQFDNEVAYRRAVALLRDRRDDHTGEPVVAVDDEFRQLDVATDGTAAAVHRVLARLDDASTPTARLSTHRPSLDDVFLSLTGQPPALETVP